MDRVMAECEGMLANARAQERAAGADRAAAAAERAGATRAAAAAAKGAGAGVRRSLPGNALKARPLYALSSSASPCLAAAAVSNVGAQRAVSPFSHQHACMSLPLSCCQAS